MAYPDDELAQALAELKAQIPAVSFASDHVDMDVLAITEEETACVVDFMPRRRAEFAAGRRAARKALARFDLQSSSIVANARGVPMFPAGHFGSITHKGPFAVAAAGRVGDVISIGIDLEFDSEPEENALLARVCTERELSTAECLGQIGVTSPASLILCAKEALFKALNPLDREPRDLQDVELSFGPDGSFSVVAMEPPDRTRRVTGTFARRGDLLLSLAIVQAYGMV
jgi:4'-phosphopantetheinyl transferase EntD